MSEAKEKGTHGEEWKQEIPLGFRFCPTDQEILQYYLLRHLTGFFIPSGIIRQFDVYERNPYHIPGIESEEKFTYFFTERARKHENGSKTDRVTRDGKGHWKLTSTLTKVFAESGSYLGKKNTLVYYVKNLGDQKDIKTNWIMHEFVIAKCLVSASSSFAQPEDEHYDDLVTCRIYEKESYNNLERSKEHRNLIDYLIGPNPNTIQPPLQPSPEVINEVKLEEDILDLGDPNGGDLQDILSVSPPYESFGDYLKSLGI